MGVAGGEALSTKPELIAAQVERMKGQGADPQLISDREVTQKALERQSKGTQRLVSRLREADDELAAIIERELLQAEREKQQLLNTLADLNAQIGQQEQAAANLQSLYGYCRDVERELKTFEFAEKRLALEALGAQVRASGREWSLVANLPIDDVVPRRSC